MTFAKICPLTDVGHPVTGQDAPEPALARIAEAGVRVAAARHHAPGNEPTEGPVPGRSTGTSNPDHVVLADPRATASASSTPLAVDRERELAEECVDPIGA